MKIRMLLKLMGGLLVILGSLIAVPGLFSLLQGGETAIYFFEAALGAIGIGAVLWLSHRKYQAELNHRTGFAIVALSWLSAGFLGAFPYYLSGTLPSFVDALFESISGFSGTGASVLPFIDGQDRAILLWRSMTQWLGGMGIIVFFIAILPILGVGGVHLFKAEITGPQKDKITPRVRETAKRLWLLYMSFTLILIGLLWMFGMSLYDAVNHSLTTLSTGGFSTHGDGIAYFQSVPIQIIIAAFMLFSSVNFSLHFRLIAFRDYDVLFSTELKWYLAILFVVTILCAYSVAPSSESLGTALLDSAFTVICTASSTGFTNVDYLSWPVGTHVLIILLMVMGGMSGSTAGGVKCIRLVAAMKQLLKELKQVVHPSAVYAIKANDSSIPKNTVAAIWGFIFIYFFIFSVLTTVLAFQGIDLVSSSTAVFSALSNIGPAFGDFGPYDNYAELNVVSKAVLCAGMLLGRLEFYTLLVLLTPEYWRK